MTCDSVTTSRNGFYLRAWTLLKHGWLTNEWSRRGADCGDARLIRER